MANQITGRVHLVKPTETREHRGNTYYQRTIVLDATRYDPYTGEAQFPNFPAFEFMGEDKCRELDNFIPNDVVGGIVTISFDVRGAKYSDKQTGEEKFFNRVVGFKIEPYAARQSVPTAATDTPMPAASEAHEVPENKTNDDLPF